MQRLFSLMFDVRNCLMKYPEFKKVVIEKNLMYIRTKNGKTLNLYDNNKNDNSDDNNDDNDDNDDNNNYNMNNK